MHFRLFISTVRGLVRFSLLIIRLEASLEVVVVKVLRTADVRTGWSYLVRWDSLNFSDVGTG